MIFRYLKLKKQRAALREQRKNNLQLAMELLYTHYVSKVVPYISSDEGTAERIKALALQSKEYFMTETFTSEEMEYFNALAWTTTRRKIYDEYGLEIQQEVPIPWSQLLSSVTLEVIGKNTAEIKRAILRLTSPDVLEATTLSAEKFRFNCYAFCINCLACKYTGENFQKMEVTDQRVYLSAMNKQLDLMCEQQGKTQASLPTLISKVKKQAVYQFFVQSTDWQEDGFWKIPWDNYTFPNIYQLMSADRETREDMLLHYFTS